MNFIAQPNLNVLSDFVPEDNELYAAFSTALRLIAKIKGSRENPPTSVWQMHAISAGEIIILLNNTPLARPSVTLQRSIKDCSKWQICF